MVNKVSWSHNYASFKKLWKIFCTYVTYFWLKRRRICRRIYFMYHLYIKNWKQKTFGNNYYPLFTSPHIIAQSPPSDVVTDPSGRTSADKYLGHLLLPYLWFNDKQSCQMGRAKNNQGNATVGCWPRVLASELEEREMFYHGIFVPQEMKWQFKV